jgi:hypothetical protein
MRKLHSTTSEKHLRRVGAFVPLCRDDGKTLTANPTLFVRKKVFAMFDNNPAAAGLPAPIGIQETASVGYACRDVDRCIAGEILQTALCRRVRFPCAPGLAADYLKNCRPQSRNHAANLQNWNK